MGSRVGLIWRLRLSLSVLALFSSRFCLPLHVGCVLVVMVSLPPVTRRASQVALAVKDWPANAGHVGLIPGLRRSPGVENGNILQYSCLENSMDRGAWRATAHGTEKSQTGAACIHH